MKTIELKKAINLTVKEGKQESRTLAGACKLVKAMYTNFKLQKGMSAEFVKLTKDVDNMIAICKDTLAAKVGESKVFTKLAKFQEVLDGETTTVDNAEKVMEKAVKFGKVEYYKPFGYNVLELSDIIDDNGIGYICTTKKDGTRTVYIIVQKETYSTNDVLNCLRNYMLASQPAEEANS